MSKLPKPLETSWNGRNGNRRTWAVPLCLAVLGLVPVVASAHEGSFPHVHPHELGTVTIFVGIIAMGLVLRQLYRRHR